MARQYGRIRPVPDTPLEVAAAPPDYRVYAVLAGGSILAGLLAFGALVYVVFFTFNSFVPSLTDGRSATMTATVGTIELREAGSSRWSLAGSGQQLREGDTLRTRENSRALITLFDQSTATLYPLTEVTVLAMRTNRIGSALHSPPRTLVRLRETSGRALLGVAHLNPVASLQFDVESGQGRASLSEGSYIVKVTPNQTFEVVATRGRSVVSGAGGEVVIRGG